MSDAPRSDSPPAIERDFVVFLGVLAAAVLITASPWLRSAVVRLITAPARLFAWIAPGDTFFEDTLSSVAGAGAFIVASVPTLDSG
ncbi:MAG: hypothetical protein MI723_05900, partial [Caulobacterales bacterium]|nr:hypothetical protein [Caulobacterales bacterium]